MSAPLVERLATSCVALRENAVYTADGQAVRLGVQADEMEEAAICITALLHAARALDAMWTEDVPHGPGEPGDKRLFAPETLAVWRHIRAAIAKATGDA